MMFDSTNNDQFDPTQSGSITNLDAQFGINEKDANIIKSSSCGLVLDTDPWADDKAGQVKANTNASTDDLTGEEAGVTQGFNAGGNVIQGGDTSIAEKQEVANLLNNRRYNRDSIAGTRTYSNSEWISEFDRGDSRNNAHNVGTIVYRENAVINGNIGHTLGGIRDKDDFFKFTVGKAGEIQLSLTVLRGNTGLALYNRHGNLLGFSDKAGNASESIRKYLAKGDYYAKAFNYNESRWNHAPSHYRLNIERKADALESFWQGRIRDASIKNAALNSIKYENHLSREDVIGIINSSRDIGSVTSSEVTDLRNFYNYAINTTPVRDDVKVLSNKVLFGDRSNQWYTGSDSVRDTLGNLRGGTSSTDMGLLIGKHFLGTDRPAIETNDSGSYTRANGTLFKNGVSSDDIGQGSVGTCYVLAALSGTANDKPNVINNMFTDNGDGTWSVKFTTGSTTDYVTVDRMMATYNRAAGGHLDGRYIYANDGGDNSARNIVVGDNELWGALAEKAYAQLNESNKIGQDGTNSYGGISGGSSGTAIKHITGIGTTTQRVTDIYKRHFDRHAQDFYNKTTVSSSELQALVNSNKVVTVSGFDSSADGGYEGETNVQSGIRGHAYALTGYNPTNGRYTIHNPHDRHHLSFTFEQLRVLNAKFRWSIS